MKTKNVTITWTLYSISFFGWSGGFSCVTLLLQLLHVALTLQFLGVLGDVWKTTNTFGEFWQGVPSRELTYPTLGKGKSSSKCHFGGICSSLEGNLSLFMKPLVLELESEYSNLMFSSHQLRLASGRLPIDLSPKHIDYNHPGCFPYQKVKPIYSWWFQFNPFEKICNRQIGSFPQTFGMKIPKIFELPPPRKLMYVWWCLMRVPSSLTGPILLVRAQKSGGSIHHLWQVLAGVRGFFTYVRTMGRVRYMYLHEGLNFYGFHVGKYTSLRPMDGIGIVRWVNLTENSIKFACHLPRITLQARLVGVVRSSKHIKKEMGK